MWKLTEVSIIGGSSTLKVRSVLLLPWHFRVVSARSKALLVLSSFARWKAHDCRASFPNFRGASIIGLFANIWTFYLTRRVVYNVRRVLPLRQKGNKARTVLADDDIHVFKECEFFSDSFTKRAPERET